MSTFFTVSIGAANAEGSLEALSSLIREHLPRHVTGPQAVAGTDSRWVVDGSWEWVLFEGDERLDLVAFWGTAEAAMEVAVWLRARIPTRCRVSFWDSSGAAEIDVARGEGAESALARYSDLAAKSRDRYDAGRAEV